MREVAAALMRNFNGLFRACLEFLLKILYNSNWISLNLWFLFKSLFKIQNLFAKADVATRIQYEQVQGLKFASKCAANFNFEFLALRKTRLFSGIPRFAAKCLFLPVRKLKLSSLSKIKERLKFASQILSQTLISRISALQKFSLIYCPLARANFKFCKTEVFQNLKL